MPDDYIPSYAIPVAGFQSKKAAQLAAFFALKPRRREIDKLKLIKIIYMTERAFLADHHVPMLFDELYSLPHGPICSSTLNGIDGVIHQETWSDYIVRSGNRVMPVRSFARHELDEISNAEIDVAEKTWQMFGGMTATGIRNYSHEYCPEYTETAKARIPIAYKDILEAVNDPAAEDVDREIHALRRAEGLLAV